VGPWPEQKGSRGIPTSDDERLWRADYCIAAYGVQDFYSDLEAGREYWRERDSIVHASLDWVGGEGFDEFFRRYGDWPWKTSRAFRQRDMIPPM
jgi:hypothetical protein